MVPVAHIVRQRDSKPVSLTPSTATTPAPSLGSIVIPIEAHSSEEHRAFAKAGSQRSMATTASSVISYPRLLLSRYRGGSQRFSTSSSAGSYPQLLLGTERLVKRHLQQKGEQNHVESVASLAPEWRHVRPSSAVVDMPLDRARTLIAHQYWDYEQQPRRPQRTTCINGIRLLFRGWTTLSCPTKTLDQPVEIALKSRSRISEVQKSQTEFLNGQVDVASLESGDRHRQQRRALIEHAFMQVPQARGRSLRPPAKSGSLL